MFKKLLIATFFLINTSVVFAQSHIIYLTRHAEKQTEIKNPGLTPQGQQRATNIAHMLEQANIKNIYSTAYKRTQQTAKPLSELLEIPVQSYNPRQLAIFAKKLKNMTGNTLVVGHSNTTPVLLSLLNGQKVKPIAEDEFNRLYQVIIDDNNNVTTIQLSSLPKSPSPFPANQKH